MDQKNINRNSLANKIGTNRSVIGRLIKDKTKSPQRGTLLALSGFFGCNLEWLATGEGEIFPQENTGTKYEVNQSADNASDVAMTGVATNAKIGSQVIKGNVTQSERDSHVTINEGGKYQNISKELEEVFDLLAVYGSPSLLKMTKEKCLKIKEALEGE